MRRLILPLVAVAGFVIAFAAVRADRVVVPAAPTAATSVFPKPPFASWIAGAGLVEAEGGNVAIGTPTAGIVRAIDVTWGERVEAGAPLVEIDARDLEAQMPTARARVEEAKATVDRTAYLLAHAENLHGDRLASDEELAQRHFDAADARAALATRQAEVAQIEAEIARRTVRAPTAGRILRIDVRVGERAESGPGAAPVLILGAGDRLAVRVEIDESDAWRLEPEAKARAYVRGNPALSTDLRFERIEPVVEPKRSLTGASAERTDTRVLQVLYTFDRDALPVHVGQLLDVFVEAPAATPEK